MDKKLLRLEGEVEIERRHQEHNDDDNPHLFIVEDVHTPILSQVSSLPISPRAEDTFVERERFEISIPFPVCRFFSTPYQNF
jgi:hypothetical protein